MFNKIRTIRKRWLATFAVAALLAVGLVAGAAFAADVRSDHNDPDDYDYARHGEKSPDADARFQSYTAGLVADGVITQAQADAANSWFAGRPHRAEVIAAWRENRPDFLPEPQPNGKRHKHKRGDRDGSNHHNSDDNDGDAAPTPTPTAAANN